MKYRGSTSGAVTSDRVVAASQSRAVDVLGGMDDTAQAGGLVSREKGEDDSTVC